MPSMYDYDVLIESYPSLPENPETGRWYEVAPEGSRCSEGSAWHGLVQLGADAGKVLVFFLGGGVSLNEEMSRDNARRCVFAPTVILQDYIVEYGILSDAPENPFRNWTRLVVEYATGDFHMGTNEFRCTGVDITVNHIGYNNYTLFMDEVLPLIGEPDTLVVTGSSAGGFATALLTDDVMARIPSAANVTACVDSALLYYDGWLQTARDLWRAPDAICERLTRDNIVLDALVALRRSHNGVKILFTGSTHDHDLQLYQTYIDTGVMSFETTHASSALYLDNLRRMCADMREQLPGVGLYIWEAGLNPKDGSTQHMIMPAPNCFDPLSGEKSVAEWLYDATQGDVRSYGLELLEG